MLHMNDFLNENKGSGHNYNESIEGGYFSRKVRCINEKKRIKGEVYYGIEKSQQEVRNETYYENIVQRD